MRLDTDEITQAVDRLDQRKRLRTSPGVTLVPLRPPAPVATAEDEPTVKFERA